MDSAVYHSRRRHVAPPHVHLCHVPPSCRGKEIRYSYCSHRLVGRRREEDAQSRGAKTCVGRGSIVGKEREGKGALQPRPLLVEARVLRVSFVLVAGPPKDRISVPLSVEECGGCGTPIGRVQAGGGGGAQSGVPPRLGGRGARGEGGATHGVPM